MAGMNGGGEATGVDNTLTQRHKKTRKHGTAHHDCRKGLVTDLHLDLTVATAVTMATAVVATSTSVHAASALALHTHTTHTQAGSDSHSSANHDADQASTYVDVPGWGCTCRT